MEKGYDYILEMDADFSHDPKDLVNSIPLLQRRWQRRIDRLALCYGGKRGELADRPGAAVVLCQQLRAPHYEHADTRYDGRICVLPQKSTGDNTA